MDSRTGTSRGAASAKASGPHSHQSTGFSLCCRRYGLVEAARRFGMAIILPAGPSSTRLPTGEGGGDQLLALRRRRPYAISRTVPVRTDPPPTIAGVRRSVPVRGNEVFTLPSVLETLPPPPVGPVGG